MAINKGKSMCFFSAKGGVGKTTNILNLAGIFSELDKKVLVIDFDLYSGGIATYLNSQNDNNIYSMSFALLNGTFKDFNDYTSRITNNIDILSAPKDPRDANKIDSSLVRDIIRMAENNYDVVLIDTNHSLNEVNLTILDSVDNILFMITNDPLDLKNTKSLLSILDSLDFNNYYILLNNSRDPFKTYFNLKELNKILEHDINYELSRDLFLKDMDKMIMQGKIVSLEKKFPSMMMNDYKTFVQIATNFLGRNDENE